VNLLLDTHIALWAISSDPKLGPAASELIADPANTIHVSAVAILEIAIKRVRRPAALSISAEEAKLGFEQAGYGLLEVTAAHAAAYEKLAPIHRDPFDRLLVAQALTEPLRLMTRDKTVAAYSDSILLV